VEGRKEREGKGGREEGKEEREGKGKSQTSPSKILATALQIHLHFVHIVS